LRRRAEYPILVDVTVRRHGGPAIIKMVAGMMA
jgi:hypothetical protein